MAISADLLAKVLPYCCDSYKGGSSTRCWSTEEMIWTIFVASMTTWLMPLLVTCRNLECIAIDVARACPQPLRAQPRWAKIDNTTTLILYNCCGSLKFSNHNQQGNVVVVYARLMRYNYNCLCKALFVAPLLHNLLPPSIICMSPTLHCPSIAREKPGRYRSRYPRKKLP